jgi:hypothetical protein
VARQQKVLSMCDKRKDQILRAALNGQANAPVNGSGPMNGEPDEAWLPAGAVTGPGPMPQLETEAALRYVVRACPSVPFWPQLPQRAAAERPVAQALSPLGGMIEPMVDAPWCYTLSQATPLDTLLGTLADADPALPVEAARGFYALEQALDTNRFPHATAVKGQIVGPITLAMHLYRGGPRGRPFADHPQLIHALGRYLSRVGQWQYERLKRFGLPVILFVDEPVLGTQLAPAGDAGIAPALAALSSTLAELRAAGAIAGLRCGHADASCWLDEASPDLYAFDAHHGLSRFCSEAASQGFVQRGGHVAYGLVPTGQALDGLTAEGLFSRWLQTASLMGDVTTQARRTLITPAGGLGRVDLSAVSATFSFAHRISYLVNWIASGHHSANQRSA